MKLFLYTKQSGVGLGLRPFEAVCIATETPDEPPRYRKPSPRFILEMLERHGIAPEAAWMLGDSPADWGAGLNAGIRAAAIVPDPLAAKEPARREELSIDAFASVLDWLLHLTHDGTFV